VKRRWTFSISSISFLG